jgi:hypothetical protein
VPSERKQFNVRMSQETAARVERLIPLVNAAVGVELSQAQFFELAIRALAEKHGAAEGATAREKPKAPAKRAKGGA